MGLWADLLGLKEPDPTIRLFAPAQVDFGRRMRIASNVFIDRSFTAPPSATVRAVFASVLTCG